MTYDERKPLKKAGNQPAPQYWNEDLGDWEIVKGSGGGYRMQSPVDVAEDTFSATGNLTKEFAEVMNGISIVNDGTGDLTLTVHGKSRVVKAGESYNGRFKPFTSVIVNSSGPWRAEALQTYVAAPVITQPSDTIAPTNVTNLVASNILETSLTLTWTAATDNVGVTGYDVYRGASLVGSVIGTLFNATGLTQATQYTYTIKAKDAAGNVSPGTQTTVTTAATPVDTTPPNNVTNVATTNVTHNSLTVTWSVSSSSDVASYEVYRGAILLGTVTGTLYNVTGLTPSTQYTFTVKAKDASTNVASGTSVTVSTNAQPADTTPPTNVTNLATSATTQTGVTLSWTASVSSDIKDYRVYNGSTLITTVTGTTHNVTGLTASTTYTFTVKARDTSDNEATGASVNVTTSAEADTTAPNPITGLTIGVPTQTTIPLTWVLSSSSDVTTQEVAYSKDATNFIVASAVVNASSTAYTVTGLTANTAYTLRVVAIDGAGNRSTAVTVTATTGMGEVTVLAEDNFNRANGTMGNATTGQPWNNATTQPTILNNQLAYTAAATNYPNIDVGVSNNIAIEMDFTLPTLTSSTGNNSGIVARTNGTTQGCIFGAKLNGTKVGFLSTITGASASPADVNFAFVAGQVYRLKLEVRGNEYKGYVDGTLIVTYTDTNNAGLTSTKHGVCFYNITVPRGDNFKITSI